MLFRAKGVFPFQGKGDEHDSVSPHGATPDQLRLACALERHRIARGSLSEALDALVPQWIDRIPVDVIDGQPIRYRIEPEGGYRLYSIGWNEVDDNGTPGKTREQGDWVFRIPSE